MSETIKNNYFSLIKFLCILLLLIYFIISNNLLIKETAHKFFLLTCIVTINTAYELINSKKFIVLILEIVFVIIYLLCYGSDSLLLIPFVVLDALVYFHLPPISYLIPFLGLLACDEERFLYFILCTFTAIFYYQNFIIIAHYQKIISSYEYEENKLKDNIDHNKILYHKELEQSMLSYENKMLEEKARIYQALHDKLGHSINGSIYQLEACKVIMKDNPKESKGIVQSVINNLRGSMDEIRYLFRKENPNKSRSSYIQLMKLCDDCMKKYNINAELSIDGDKNKIPEQLWEILLDNTVEALTNSLKYSQCKNIMISIFILNKIIRFNIKDDGIGCDNITEGMGLQGMIERAKKYNGIVTIQSSIGFEINTIFPINNE